MSTLTRRQLLINASKTYGILELAQLLEGKNIAQAQSGMENIIFIYFYHGVNIPVTNYKEGRAIHQKGDWSYEPGGLFNKYIPQLKNSSRIIRGVSQKFNTPDNNHIWAQSSVLSGCSLNPNRADFDRGNKKYSGNYQGKSIDVLLGEHLQKRFNCPAPYLIAGHEADQSSSDPTPMWVTSTFLDHRTYVRPITSPFNLYQTIEDGLGCIPAAKVLSQHHINTYREKLNEQNFTLDHLLYSAQLFFKQKKINSQHEKQIVEQIKQKKDILAQKIKGLNGNKLNICNGSLQFDTNYLQSISRFEKRNVDGYKNRNKEINKLVTYSLKNNYTKVATVYHNNINNKFHDHAHKSHEYHRVVTESHSVTFDALNDLVRQLQQQGLYNKTMIVLSCEFSNQASSHNVQNMPWLVINGTDPMDVDLEQKLHIGDLHTSIAHRFGLSLTDFGASTHETGRHGRYNPKLLG